MSTRAKKKPQQVGRKGKITFKIKLHKLPWFVLGTPPPQGDFTISSLSWMLVTPRGHIFQRGSQLISLDPSGEIQAYPFPCNINFPDFHCLVNLSWYEVGRGSEMFSDAFKYFFFLLLAKYLLAVCLKFFKQIKLH